MAAGNYMSEVIANLEIAGELAWIATLVSSGSSTAVRSFPSISHVSKDVQLSWAVTFPTMFWMRHSARIRPVLSINDSPSVMLQTHQAAGSVHACLLPGPEGR